MEAEEGVGDDNKNRSKTEAANGNSREQQLRILSVDKVTVEKIVLESSSGSREVLLTKNESSKKLSIKSELEKPVLRRGSKDRRNEDKYRASLPDDITSFDPCSQSREGAKKSRKEGERIKPIKLTKSPSIGSLTIAIPLEKGTKRREKATTGVKTADEDKENKSGEVEEGAGGEIEKINAKNLLERSQTNIEVLQQNLNTKIGANTARRYKKKLLESRENPKSALVAASSKLAFDEEFLQKHNLDKRLKIEEYDLRGSAGIDEQEAKGRPSYRSEKVLEVEKRWSGEFLRNQLDRHSSESSKSSYVGEYGSVSSGESIGDEYDPATSLFGEEKGKFEGGRPINLRTSEKTLAASTLSTLDSDSCLEDRIKSLEEDIEEAKEKDDGGNDRGQLAHDSPVDLWQRSAHHLLLLPSTNDSSSRKGSRIEEVDNKNPFDSSEAASGGRVDGYASLVKRFAMEAGSSKKEEKQRKKLGFRRLLPGFFSPKDSRKDYKKKESKERKRPDERHFARYQQNGNYTRSPDTMNLNEDIKRNVKLDNSLNGSIIEERLDEIKRELFPDQGPITSTPDHLARDHEEEDREGLLRDRGGQPRSYTTDSSLSSIAPDERWNGQLGISPDIRKFEQRQRREEFGQRYGQLERKHSLQEASRHQPNIFQRNHGPSGRISAPPAERYLVRPRAIHPIDRPLPAIPRSRTSYENYLEGERRGSEKPGGSEAYPDERVLYENESGLILKSVSAQVKITRQPIVNQNQRAPLVGRSPKYLSSGSSQKSGDYGGESSCTPNSSQKSEFSPTSSKSGEYYLHSPRNSGSPNERPDYDEEEEEPRREEEEEEVIYENEKSPEAGGLVDERIYDETPASILEDRDKRVPSSSPRRSRSREENGEGPSSPTGKPISPFGSRQRLPRRAQPNEQILIASPKRDAPYETRIPRPCNESRRGCVESPVHMTSTPRKLANSIEPDSARSDASKGSPPGQQARLEAIPRPEPVYAHRGHRNPEIASPPSLEKKMKAGNNVQRCKDGEERVAWVQASSSSPQRTSGETVVDSQKIVDRSISSYEDRRQNPVIPASQVEARSSNRNPEEQRIPQQQDQRQGGSEDSQRICEPMCGQRTIGPLSPSKQETRQHLEAFYWQQKALEAHRKSLASPVSENSKQMGRKIDLPEVREAVYWQQLKKLDEEQQRRIYEQNLIEESSYCKPRRVSQGRQGSIRGLPLLAAHGNPSSWSGNLRNSKGNPAGKPPLMQSQKGQNQPVLIVRPQQAIRDRRDMVPAAKPLEPGAVHRSKSASPHLHRGEGQPVPRKLEVSSIYEEEASNDADGKTAHPPPPIFKRGSLIGGESVEYGSGSSAKRVSFSNQSGVGGQDLASGSWPTKHGTAPEPPTRRHRSEDSVSDTDSVFSYPDRRDPSTHCADGTEYDADRPLPPLPKDAISVNAVRFGRSVAYGDTRCNVGTDPRRAISPQRALRQKGEILFLFFSFSPVQRVQFDLSRDYLNFDPCNS